MSRSLVVLVVLLSATSIFAAAYEWTELGTAATVLPHPESGLPSIIFNASLAYDEVPETMTLRIAWKVFEVDEGEQTVLYEYTKTTARGRGVAHIYSSSRYILIEAGRQYGAHVSIEDLENGLSYQHSYSYFVPQSLPVGLRFVLWDDTQEVDLSGLSDEELQQLVSLQHELASDEILAEGVSISSFFSQYASADEDYPVSVVLLPETGVDNNWGSESQPITVTFGLTVLAFSIPTPGDRTAFQEQLSEYDQTFTGTVYAGSVGEDLGQGVVVFVQDSMKLILDTALQEQAARSGN